MTRRSIILSCASALVFASTASRARAREPAPEIPRVTTLEELRALKRVRVGEWDVRVGMSDGGPEAGPWELVYCHAVHTGAGDPPRLRPVRGGQDEFLGPLVVWAMDDRYQRALHRTLTDAGVLPKEALFCQIVLLPAKAKYRVELLGAEGEPLYRSRIDVTEPRPCHWQPFAEVRRRDGQRMDVLAEDARAARPRYNGAVSILPEVVPKEPAAKSNEATPRNRLPGAVPADPRWSTLGSIELAAGGGGSPSGQRPPRWCCGPTSTCSPAGG